MTRSQYALLIIGLAVIVLAARTLYTDSEKPKPDPRGKSATVYPLHTVCEFFDMSKSGYVLIKNQSDRSSCMNKVARGTWEMKEMETSKCKHKYADGSFGKEFLFRHEWCLPKRYR